MVAREDMPTTMVCTDTPGNGVVAINWRIKSLRADEWKLILSAKETERFSGGALKPSMRLTDPNFHDTGVFSLFLLPKLEDSGLYSCLMIQQDKPLKERKILLAILTGEKISCCHWTYFFSYPSHTMLYKHNLLNQNAFDNVFD